MLQSMGSQRIGHDLETAQQQKDRGDQNDQKSGNSNKRRVKGWESFCLKKKKKRLIKTAKYLSAWLTEETYGPSEKNEIIT